MTVQLALAHGVEQVLDLVAGIDDHRLARLLARDDEAVLEEGRRRVADDLHDVQLIERVLETEGLS